MPASPDPDLALRLAKATVDVYGTAAQRLLELVAGRLARGIDRPGWAEQKLLETVRLRDQAQAIVDQLIEAGPDAVREAITAAFARGVRDAAGDLTVGELRAGGPPSATAVDALVTEAITQVSATHGGILRQVLDVYRTVIGDATSQVAAGATTRLQAAQVSLDRFAARGITGFVDAAGRRWELESYTEMAVRTAAGRAQVAGTLDRFRATGRDLVIVSDHTQECRLCRPWEGRVLSITGRTVGYPTVAEARADGLLHANCRHNLTAFVAGLTKAPRQTADPDGDAARQEQRRLERGVREWKRREAAALNDAARRRARAQVRGWQARLREHVDSRDDLRRRPERERTGTAR